MARNNNMQRVNDDIKDIRKHVEKLNEEMGDVNVKIAKIETSWTWMRWVIGANVTLWVAVLYMLFKVSGA